MSPFKYGMIVDGEHYCPRPELSRQFVKLIEAGQNVVVQGERRMGKTSFVCETIRGKRGMRLYYVDLYCVKTLAELCRRLVAAVSSLDRSEGFLRKTARIISGLRPVLTIDGNTGAPSLTVDLKGNATLASLEEILDMVAQHAKSGKTCMVFDEFQDVLGLDEADVVLARLRAKIQFQNTIPHVFLGSVRNRMHEIFDSPKSPFYKSATAFSVGPIEVEAFKSFLIGRFKSAKRKIDSSAVDRIIELADRVSGDAQELCETVWLATEDGDRIGDREIEKGLALVFAREQRNFGEALSRLTPIQASVLRGLADPRHPKLFSGEFMSSNGVRNVGSVTRAVNRLKEEEFVYEFEGVWKFTNPFFREWLLHCT